MKPTRVLLTGSEGRMGKEISGVISADPEIEVVASVDRSTKNKELPGLTADRPDVVIDFSSPELMREVLTWCLKTKIPLVSGTTGLLESDFQLLKEVSVKVPILWSANMSVGVAIVTEMLKAFKASAQNFEYQIEEIHHNRKVDAPSGTAVALQNELEALDLGPIPPPLSIRGGGVFGIHKIFAMSEEEMITIEHTALNRRVFARGAVASAKWLVGKAPGLYNIRDVLGFRERG